jgi:hypothetical protein
LMTLFEHFTVVAHQVMFLRLELEAA